jgi:hypothetical protein
MVRLDDDILALDVAQVLRPLPKAIKIGRVWSLRAGR